MVFADSLDYSDTVVSVTVEGSDGTFGASPFKIDRFAGYLGG